MARRIKGGIKRRETDSASNQFPKCSPQPGTHKERDSQSLVEKRRGREEIEVTWWRKRRFTRGREQSGQRFCCQVKMGCEVWVLKGTKLITNTKKQRLKILSRGEIAKNTVLKKKKERKKAKNRKKQSNQ